MKTILLAGLFAMIGLGSLGFIGFAYGQYLGNTGEAGETGKNTLEETLELAKRRIEAAEANPASGSGTPYLDASGVVGSSIIAGAVFGGIAGALFFKSRSGRYAAQGRG